MSLMRMRAKDVLWRTPLRLHNSLRNRQHQCDEPILFVQNSVTQRGICRDFLHWVNHFVPELRNQLEFATLPLRPRAIERARLIVFWGGDALMDRAPWLYRAAVELSEQCLARGIPVINAATHWPKATKSRTADLIRQSGVLRTPRATEILAPGSFARDRAGLELPLLVREDRGHQQFSFLVKREEQLREIPWQRFQRPVAVEFIDTQGPDGLYRKYRYVGVGGTGISKHLMFDTQWKVCHEQVLTAATVAEELAFVEQPDPNHAVLQAARRRLGLDVVAFDYAYDADGQLVVWEANPFPDTNFPRNPAMRHIFNASRRTFAALAWLLLRRAGRPAPLLLEELLADMPDDERAAPRLLAA